MTTFIKFLNQIKSVPRCIDCKNYLVTNTENMYAAAKCKKVKYNSCHTQEVNQYEYAYIARSDDKMCGPHGSKFDPKNIV
jgi:hypothetical protein